MSSEDHNLFETGIRAEGKTLFVDLRENKFGIYLKLTEKNRAGAKKTVLIPASAIADLSNALSKARELSGAPSKSGKTAASNISNNDDTFTKVFVNGLAWATTDNALFDHFCAHVAPKGAKVSATKSGRSLGFGIVEFHTHDDAVNAIEELNDTMLDGRKIRCRQDREVRSSYVTAAQVASNEKKTKTPKEKPVRDIENRIVNPRKIFIRNLAYDTTEEDVSEIFSAIGHVSLVEIIKRKRDGKSLGQAIITFEDADHATEAKERFNGKDLGGRELQIRDYYNN